VIRRPVFLLVATLFLAAACGGGDGERRRPEPPRTSMVAAGDVASCWWRGDEATARLLDRIPGVIAALGDLVYQDGTPQQFARCYGPTWGRHLDRTRPTPGNHDYRYRKGAGYYDYFGARAGEPRKGWYSYELDGWHVAVLNSEEEIGAGSEQLRWLEADLRAHPARCTMVYTHRPRFSSGKHGGSDRMEDVFRVMYDNGVDVLLGGHDHHYERFAPQTPDGRRDDARGVRQFVIGTGGSPTYRLGLTLPNSEVRDARSHGVVRFVLSANPAPPGS
jgi:3',5'-cyclic AMP phosphodiesterase CpdA